MVLSLHRPPDYAKQDIREVMCAWDSEESESTGSTEVAEEMQEECTT